MRLFIKIGLVLLLSIAVIEVILRALGYEPYSAPKHSFQVSPEFCYGSDSLGISLKPGKYDILINEGLQFSVTHSKAGFRALSSLPESDSIQVHLYGCSYVYGTGVNDQDTYPSLLQANFPGLAITNFAVPGYGTIQFYLQFKKNIQNHNIPTIAVLNVASFHEERNLLSKSYLYKLYQGYEMLSLTIPSYQYYPRFQQTQDGIKVQYCNLFEEYHPLPFRNISSIANLIELGSLEKNSTLNSSFALITEIASLCEQHEIELIIADVDSISEDFHVYCQKNKLQYVNISPDFSQEFYRNLPFDYHPSQEAHKHYAQKLGVFLEHYN